MAGHCRLLCKLEGAYDGIWDTPHAFQYLTRFVHTMPTYAILPFRGGRGKLNFCVLFRRSKQANVWWPPELDYPSVGRLYCTFRTFLV